MTDVANGRSAERFDILAAARAGARRTWPVLALHGLVFVIALGTSLSAAEFVVALFLFLLWAGGAISWLAYLVWRAHRVWRRLRVRAAYESATSKAGVSLESVQVSRLVRGRHALRGSMEPFLAMCVPGALISGVAMTWGNFIPGLLFGLSWLSITLSGVGVLVLRDAFREDDESLHAARAEAAYREVVREGADLGGALSVGVASTRGGDLSIRAESGSLGGSEEVVLDFEGAHTQDESTAAHAVEEV